jgi:hypothetical protein
VNVGDTEAYLKASRLYSLEEIPGLRIDGKNNENHPNVPKLVERMPQAKHFVVLLTILGKYRIRSTESSNEY